MSQPAAQGDLFLLPVLPTDSGSAESPDSFTGQQRRRGMSHAASNFRPHSLKPLKVPDQNEGPLESDISMTGLSRTSSISSLQDGVSRHSSISYVHNPYSFGELDAVLSPPNIISPLAQISPSCSLYGTSDGELSFRSNSLTGGHSLQNGLAIPWLPGLSAVPNGAQSTRRGNTPRSPFYAETDIRSSVPSHAPPQPPRKSPLPFPRRSSASVLPSARGPTVSPLPSARRSSASPLSPSADSTQQMLRPVQILLADYDDRPLILLKSRSNSRSADSPSPASPTIPASPTVPASRPPLAAPVRQPRAFLPKRRRSRSCNPAPGHLLSEALPAVRSYSAPPLVKSANGMPDDICLGTSTWKPSPKVRRHSGRSMSTSGEPTCGHPKPWTRLRAKRGATYFACPQCDSRLTVRHL